MGSTVYGGHQQSSDVDENAAASNEIVSAVAGNVLRCNGVQLIAAGAVTVTLEDEDGNNLWGPVALAANGGFVLPPNDRGYFDAPSGKAIHLLLSGAVQVGGGIQYTAGTYTP